jgi:hypothetical protein
LIPAGASQPYQGGARRYQVAKADKATAVLNSLHYPLLKFQSRTVLVPGRTLQSVAEHLDLLAAIEAGDAAPPNRLAAGTSGRFERRSSGASLSPVWLP